MPQRRFKLAIAYGLLLLPAVILQASHAVRSGRNSPLTWAPAHSPARAEYDDFVRAFGPGDVVVISWQGCTIESRALDTVADVLQRDPRFFSEEEWLFDRVTSGRQLMQHLVAADVPVAEAIDRLRGSFIGPDGRSTWLVVGLTERGLMRRGELVGQIQQVIANHASIPPVAQHLAGPVMDGDAVDQASASTLQQLAVPSAIVVFCVTLLTLNSCRAAVIVFACSIYCQALTLALVSLCGDSMSALLIVLPPLIQVLAVAGGIHLVNYYDAAVASCDPRTAAQQALRVGWLPCVLSAGTTAVGMASLMVSELKPIRAFGAYSTAGLLITTGIVLAVVPVALAFCRVRPVPTRTESHGAATASSTVDGVTRWVDTLAWFHGPIVVVFILIMAIAGVGWLRLTTSIRIETMFSPESDLLADYRWLESRVAPMVPIEVVATFDADCPFGVNERLELVHRIEQQLATCQHVKGTLSAWTFMPPVNSYPPKARNTQQSIDGPTNMMLESAQPQWMQLGFLSRHNQTQRWRIRGAVSALASIDYGRLLSVIRDQVEPAILDDRGQAYAGVSLQATGIMPVVHEIQRQLMSDLRTSYLTAFLIIAIVMTIFQGGVIAGLLAMIPNVFPTLVIFGGLGWCEIPVDIGSVMTASVALGVAVDDTLHFLTHFQRSLHAGLNRREAVSQACRHCGRAMMQSSLICGAGMAVFAVSDFLPTARFAWMMVALFLAALAGDLILLPALLLGPWGRLWSPDVKLVAAYTKSAASSVSPGPKPSSTHGPLGRAVLRRSRINTTVGDDMLP